MKTEHEGKQYITKGKAYGWSYAVMCVYVARKSFFFFTTWDEVYQSEPLPVLSVQRMLPDVIGKWQQETFDDYLAYKNAWEHAGITYEHKERG